MSVLPVHAEGKLLRLKQYTFHPLPDYEGLETVCFDFSTQFAPKVKSISGSDPRLYFDMQPVHSGSLQPEQRVQGVLVRSIRSFLHRAEKRLRVVIDLNRALDFQVEQRYSREKKRLCLVIESLGRSSRPQD